MKPLRAFLPSGVQYVKLSVCIPYLAFQIYHQLKAFLNRIRRTVADESGSSLWILRFLLLYDTVNASTPFSCRQSTLKTILSRFFKLEPSNEEKLFVANNCHTCSININYTSNRFRLLQGGTRFPPPVIYTMTPRCDISLHPVCSQKIGLFSSSTVWRLTLECTYWRSD